MVKPSHILGMNARQQMYIDQNSRDALDVAYSKILTKEVLQQDGVSVPQLYAQFTSMEQVRDFDWSRVTSSFVIKPVGGNAGKGILVIKKPHKKEEGKWITVDGRVVSTMDLELHVSNILEGQYSTYGTEHMAFVEERVPVHPTFKKYVYKGTPDIRIVVYNKVPVMGMLRLPTKESEGRANLHQGAIGVGVDMATGVTLVGIHKNKQIRYLPGTKRKLNGIKIPKWTSLLKVGVAAVEAAGLAYAGVDLFIHPEKGPMVVELNANPGLSIQVANDAGLRRRLERVEGLKVRNADHGVRVGKALFAEWFADKVKAEDGLIILDNFEEVKIRDGERKWVEIEAVMDTGALRSSIDQGLAEQLGLADFDKVLWTGGFITNKGREVRPVVEMELNIRGKKVRTSASVTDRSSSPHKLLVGRQDLEGFLVNPQLRPE